MLLKQTAHLIVFSTLAMSATVAAAHPPENMPWEETDPSDDPFNDYDDMDTNERVIVLPDTSEPEVIDPEPSLTDLAEDADTDVQNEEKNNETQNTSSDESAEAKSKLEYLNITAAPDK